MISSFFVLSPRGDTILSKMYRIRPEVGAHERSHTEAFFRKVKFWNDMQSPSSLLMNSNTGDLIGSGNGSSSATTTTTVGGVGSGTALAMAGMDHQTAAAAGVGSGNIASAEAGGTMMKKVKKDPPPVFIMPDGMSYLHINRNGLLFACSTDKNVSPCTVIEVSELAVGHVIMCVY
jgi:hypothetical protein